MVPFVSLQCGRLAAPMSQAPSWTEARELTRQACVCPLAARSLREQVTKMGATGDVAWGLQLSLPPAPQEKTCWSCENYGWLT